MNPVRTRFAPSPTGLPHIGNLRTAIYAWLLARRHKGQFILRIEDTDRERKVDGAVKHIMEVLDWFGVEIDEGPSKDELAKIGEASEFALDIPGPHAPYVQSQRLARYQEVADKLIEDGYAFRCDCTAEMLQKQREKQQARKEVPGYGGRCRDRNVSKDEKHVVRFRMPDIVDLALDDAVRGEIFWEKPSLRDPVLLKSDGFPTYHLACLVDDHDMGVSHVMRGEEWLPSAPLHLLLYDALGWERPVFCHLSTILGSNGKKLSKREGAMSVNDFKAKGYLPEALLNYIVFIGWNPGEGEEQEVFSKAELCERFGVEGLSKAGGVFDPEKLLWMNGVYIRNLSVEEFTKVARPYIEDAGLELNRPVWEKMAPHVQERVKVLSEIPPWLDYLFKADFERDIDAMYKKGVDKDIALAVLKLAFESFSKLEPFNEEAIEATCREIAEKQGLKVGPAFMVLRIALTGKKVTLPLLECMVALGRDEVLRRLKETEDLIR